MSDCFSVLLAESRRWFLDDRRGGLVLESVLSATDPSALSSLSSLSSALCLCLLADCSVTLSFSERSSNYCESFE